MSGMHSDNYEFARSSAPQSIKDYSAFTDKQWNYKTDSNGGVYQTQNASVEFDLSSIYQSDGYTDVSDMYIVLPLVMVAVCTNAAGTTFYAAPTSGFSLCTLKNNFQNLIHSMELVLNGQTIHDHQSFLNVYANFKMLSSMSPSDLKSNNTNFGMAPDLDNHKSMRFSNAAPADASTTGGYGIFNNTAYNTSASYQQTIKQNDGKGNDALLQRINRIVDTTSNSSYNNLFGASRIMSSDNLKTELKPFYTTNGNYMYWFDYGIINLKYILDAIAKIGLVKKADMRLRMYVNVGAVQVTINTPNTPTTTYKSFTTSFSNTCPFTVNLLTGALAAGGFSDNGATLLTAGLYIAKPPASFSGGGTSVAITQVNSPMSACQLYYSNVKLDLTSESEYINANRAKQIIYEKIYFASVNNVASTGLVDKTITASIKNPIGIVIIPFVSKAGTGNSIGATALGFAQYESPWDTAPSTSAPLSLTGLSVSLGGKKVANEVLNYSFENFLHQVSLAETIASSDIGLNVGLVNQEFWESNRVYYMDLARSREVDKDTPRELTFKCTNNSLVPIDVLIFAVYLEKFSIDVVTGAIVS
jgi:hypothetical protein